MLGNKIAGGFQPILRDISLWGDNKMEMAKVTSKGQITIPVSIRRRLCINEGDKILFIDRPEGVVMVNPDLLQGGRPESKHRNVDAGSESPQDNEPEDMEFDDMNPAHESTTPASDAEATRPAPAIGDVKPTQKSEGVDLAALLEEIRSIGSKI